MFKFNYKMIHEEELGGKDLVELLTDDEWSCCLKVSSNPVAINYRNKKRLICFDANNGGLDHEINVYMIFSEGKKLSKQTGLPFRSPFYDMQKVHFEIGVQHEDGSNPCLDDFLEYFKQKGYSVD